MVKNKKIYIFLIIIGVAFVGLSFYSLYFKPATLTNQSDNKSVIDNSSPKEITKSITQTKQKDEPANNSENYIEEKMEEKRPLNYTDSKHEFTLNYPQEWSHTPGSNNLVCCFISPKENISDQFQENVNIVIENLDSSITTPEEYKDKSIRILKNGIRGFELLNVESTNISGLSAYRMTYKGTVNNNNLKWCSVYTIKDKKAYIISYTSEESNFEKHIKNAEVIFNSFNFIQ